ncbi:hypothetical protein B0O99DRAFT_526635 [Bisporella sp. PMI_857]|nr:hypothetical protein B0O99DRAFT_526635 [Bisporella sp. PMI_857]
MSSNKVENLLPDTLASLKRTAELCTTMNGVDDLLPVFHEVGRWVGLVQQTLQGAQDQLKAGTLDTEDDDLINTLKASKKSAKLLESIFKDVAPAAETSRLDRYQAAVRTQGKDRVEVVLLKLLGCANDLVEDELIKATAEQSMALCDAVEELSTMESSVPEDGKAGFFHSGSGDMINNTGLGTQNINKGRGTQNIAKSIKIGKS